MDKTPSEAREFAQQILKAVQDLIGPENPAAISIDASNGIFVLYFAIQPFPAKLILAKAMALTSHRLDQEMGDEHNQQIVNNTIDQMSLHPIPIKKM